MRICLMSEPRFCVQKREIRKGLELRRNAVKKLLCSILLMLGPKSSLELKSLVLEHLGLHFSVVLACIVSVFSSPNVASLLFSWLGEIFVLFKIFCLVYLSWFCSGTSKMLVWGC